uniref:CTCK domain-containing protein n=1 Tax=Salvator merianae TaxID=96440 RepID=A0A8D0E8Q9_SALMN
MESGLTLLVQLGSLNTAGSSSPACHPVNATLAAEKDNCPICMPITTTICSGYCETRDMLWKSILSSFNQRVCTYKEVRYETVLLRGCPSGTDPSFTYPVALSCHCDLCKVDSSDCTVQGTGHLQFLISSSLIPA